MKNKQQEAKESLACLVAYIAQLEQERDYLDAKCAELEKKGAESEERCSGSA